MFYGAGELLSAPSRSVVGAPPADLRAASVVVHEPDGTALAGWFARGTPGRGAVLLLHGVHGDRRQMLGRARFLRAAGYGVLLIDLPAHGESSGRRVTFGYREAEAVTAAMAFLRQSSPNERTAIIGVSLGAASTVMAGGARAQAIVLESMYPSIAEAVEDRLTMYFGPVVARLTPLLLWQLPVRLGFTANDLRPIDRIAALQAPVFVVGGTEDRHTTVAETRRLYAAAAEPKELWLVDGAAHVDLHAFSPRLYEPRIAAFLQRYLRDP